jgi:flagellar basal body-associated protein FliL
MTVHTQRVAARRPALVVPGQRLLAWIAIAVVLALIAIAMVAIFTLVGSPGTTDHVPMLEKLVELRMSTGGGGFI